LRETENKSHDGAGQKMAKKEYLCEYIIYKHFSAWSTHKIHGFHDDPSCTLKSPYREKKFENSFAGEIPRDPNKTFTLR
jgi:hypothetical protein